MRLVPKLALAAVEYAEIRRERDSMQEDAVADLELLASTLGTVLRCRS